MKRGKPLARRTPLRSKTALVGSTPSQRASRLARKPMQRKRQQATREEREARELLRARSAGTCELCGREPATDAHHRVNRSQGGRWEITNLLHLCRREHQHVTVNPAVAYERGWSVRSTNDPAAVPVFLAGHGWSLLRPDGSVAPFEKRKAA